MKKQPRRVFPGEVSSRACFGPNFELEKPKHLVEASLRLASPRPNRGGSPRRSQPTAGFSSAFCLLFAFFFPQTAGFSSVFWSPFSPKKYHGVPSPRPFDHVLPTFFPKKWLFSAFCPRSPFCHSLGGGPKGFFCGLSSAFCPRLADFFTPKNYLGNQSVSHKQIFFFQHPTFGCLFDIYKLS